jgi:dCMP deaminase
MRTLVAYVPVLHKGYLRFFQAHDNEKDLCIFGPEIIAQFPWLSKEIRQLDPVLMKKAIEALGIFAHVEILDEASARALNSSEKNIVLPNEDVSHELVTKYFPKANVMFENIFLRWDKHNSIAEKPVVPEERIARDELHRRLLRAAEEESHKSSDVWRHVGAVVVKNGKVLLDAHNHHLPSAHTPYINGDPRNNFHKGDHIEISTAIHAEASVISDAARKGIALEDADMYVTVFPCPPCAKLIAGAGIKNLYCGGGYAVLDGEDILKDAGVKIYFVE